MSLGISTVDLADSNLLALLQALDRQATDRKAQSQQFISRLRIGALGLKRIDR